MERLKPTTLKFDEDLPDIEHIYMSEKKSNHVIEKDNILKMRHSWWGKLRKKLAAKSTKIKTKGSG